MAETEDFLIRELHPGNIPSLSPDEVSKNYFPLYICVCVCVCVCVCAKSLQSCPTPCDPMDCNPSGSSVHGISQPGILEWVVISTSRGSSWPKDPNRISCTAGRFFTTTPLEKPWTITICHYNQGQRGWDCIIFHCSLLRSCFLTTYFNSGWISIISITT